MNGAETDALRTAQDALEDSVTRAAALLETVAALLSQGRNGKVVLTDETIDGLERVAIDEGKTLHRTDV